MSYPPLGQCARCRQRPAMHRRSHEFGWDDVCCECLHGALLARVEALTAERDAALRLLNIAAPYICPTCGPNVKVDEDECCAACGADCVRSMDGTGALQSAERRALSAARADLGTAAEARATQAERERDGWREKYHNDKTVWCAATAQAEDRAAALQQAHDGLRAALERARPYLEAIRDSELEHAYWNKHDVIAVIEQIDAVLAGDQPKTSASGTR